MTPPYRKLRLWSGLWIGILALQLSGSPSSAQSVAFCTFEGKIRLDEVFQLEAVGNRDQALAELEDLFHCSWNSSANVLANLQEVLVQRVKAVGNICSDGCILPLIGLFQDLYQRVSEQGRGEVSSRILGWLKILSKELRNSTEAGDADALLGRSAARLGLIELDLGRVYRAHEILLEAAKLAPRSPPILHVLGAVDEKKGEYSLARQSFGTIVEIDPGDTMAQLRLALADIRLYRKKEAHQRLENLLREASTVPWMRDLAYQELARSLAAEGEKDAAAAFLRQALTEFPASQALAVALSFLLGGDLGPLELLETSETRGRQKEVAARVLYNEWPDAELEPLREALEKDLSRTRASLRESLQLIRLLPGGEVEG